MRARLFSALRDRPEGFSLVELQAYVFASERRRQLIDMLDECQRDKLIVREVAIVRYGRNFAQQRPVPVYKLTDSGLEVVPNGIKPVFGCR